MFMNRNNFIPKLRQENIINIECLPSFLDSNMYGNTMCNDNSWKNNNMYCLGINTMMLVACGALCSLEFYNKLKAEPQLQTNNVYGYSMANKIMESCLRSVRLPCIILRWTALCVIFDVVRNLIYGALFGRNMLMKYGMIINFKDKTLTYKKPQGLYMKYDIQRRPFSRILTILETWTPIGRSEGKTQLIPNDNSLLSAVVASNRHKDIIVKTEQLQ